MTPAGPPSAGTGRPAGAAVAKASNQPTSSEMKIYLTRLTDDRHRLVVERADGTRLERELETRSVLLHDLVHFAVESEAGLRDGFWGSLASGVDLDDLLAESESSARPGLRLAESLVGPMQSVWHGRLDPEEYVARVAQRSSVVDREFVDRVLEHLRRLWGKWRGTPFHETLKLEWPHASRDREFRGPLQR